jgi:flagellin
LRLQRPSISLHNKKNIQVAGCLVRKHLQQVRTNGHVVRFQRLGAPGQVGQYCTGKCSYNGSDAGSFQAFLRRFLMPSYINTNINSLNAQRNLGMSQSSLATSMQRLSSGLRINSAKDDAAGLAISERMTTQVRGLNQAARNANDGISLAQTAEGALGQVSDNVQRIRELAVQSSNSTNTTADRAAMQKEVSQLQSEVQRVATQTQFNGTNLLDGSFTSKGFQVGANAGQIINVNSIANVQTSTLGSANFVSKTSAIASAASGAFTINNISIAPVAAQGSAILQATALASAINDKSDQTGVYATADGAGNLTLDSLKAETDITVAGTTPPVAGGTVAANSTAKTLSSVDISTFVGAQQALGIADASLNSVNSSRADLGAIQNRFSSVIANVQTSAENVTASRSRITDADFAAETANLSRSQVLQQAGTAMVAQANQLPQGVLALLR